MYLYSYKFHLIVYNERTRLNSITLCDVLSAGSVMFATGSENHYVRI